MTATLGIVASGHMEAAAPAQAVRFDASGEGYAGPTSTLNTVTHTIAAWAYLSVDRNDYSPVWSLDNGTNYFQMQTDANGTTIIWMSPSGSITNGSLVVGEWHYLATVFQTSGTDTFYHATAPSATLTAVAGSAAATGSSFTLKLGKNGFGGWFSGRVAQVKVWTAALSQAQLEAEMYVDGVVLTSNLWAYYSFRNGPQTADESGNSRTLTATGTPTAEGGPPVA